MNLLNSIISFFIGSLRLKRNLTALENLITISEVQPKSENVYYGNKLAGAFASVFNFPKHIIYKNQERFVEVIKLAISMPKSTCAEGLYKLLAQKGYFSFSKEIFTFALKHEPYYNNHDHAFVCGVKVLSDNLRIRSLVSKFIKVSEIDMGHYHDGYSDIFEQARRATHQSNLFNDNDFKDLREFVSLGVHSGFFQTRMKALVFALLFEIDESEEAEKFLKKDCINYLEHYSNGEEGLNYIKYHIYMIDSLAFYLAHREEYADKAEKYRPLQKLTRDTLLDASSADIVKKFIASYEDF